MHIFLFAGGAALAMFFVDIVGTIMTKATAENKVVLTGAMDTVGWLLMIATTFLSVDALNSTDWALKIAVVASVSVANFAGSAAGVLVNKRFIK